MVTLDGPARVIRTLTANVSKKGVFVRMPVPLATGSRVALSLEAGGRALAFAQAEVAWGRTEQSQLPGRFPGCGVRFTDFLHPRSQELVDYLVEHLDTGRPLTLPERSKGRRRWIVASSVAGALGFAAVGIGAWLFLAGPEPLEDADADLMPLVAVAPSPLELPELDLTDATLRGAGHPGASPSAPPVPAGITEREPQPSPEAAAPTAGTAASAASLPLAPSSAASTSDAPGSAASPPAAPTAATLSAAGPVAAPTVAAPTTPASTPSAAAPAAAPTVATPTTPAVTAATPAAASAVAPPAAAPRAAPPSTEAPRAAAPSSKGSLRLTSGAATRVSWIVDGNTVRLTPTLAGGARVARAFLLAGPARAVFDLEGAVPKRSAQLAAAGAHVTAVRVGKQGKGTRVVFDLDGDPVSSTVDGASLVLTY